MSDVQTIVTTGVRDKGDDVVIKVNGVPLAGWKSVKITAGIESCPRVFEATTSEATGDPKNLTVRPGDTCEVTLGDFLLVTGYVNRWNGSLSASSHEVSISGRGKCQDLVDCAAYWPGQQIMSTSVLQVAQELAKPFGISVSGASGPSVGLPGADRSSHVIPYMVLMIGETPWQLIERMCRLSGLLAFEKADGSLLLAEGPSAAEDAPLNFEVAGTGFEEGVNVLSAGFAVSDDQRFSEYTTYVFSFNPLLEYGEAENKMTVKADQGVTRYRPAALIAEWGKEQSLQVAFDRGAWEASRRWGTSHHLRITTDSWRDGTGRLYRPFTLARVKIPTLKVEDVTWMISEVTYLKDGDGTHCELTLVPPAAFAVRPTLPQYAIPAELANLVLVGQGVATIRERGRVVGGL